MANPSLQAQKNNISDSIRHWRTVKSAIIDKMFSASALKTFYDTWKANGFTAEGYKKAILKVLDNPAKYKNMRESIMKHYAFEVTYRQAGEIFDELEHNLKQSK